MVLYTLWNQENNFFLVENLGREVADGAERKVSSIKINPKSKLEEKLAGRSAYYEDTLDLCASETELTSCFWCQLWTSISWNEQLLKTTLIIYISDI